MAHSLIFANRANEDQDRLVRSVEPLIKHTSQALQMHLVNMLERGTRFGIKGYLQKTIQQPLATIMLAGHIAGVRRAELIQQQSPHPDTPPNTEISASLELSVFGGVLSYFKGRKDVDIKELQKRYNTVALEVVSGVAEDIKQDLQATTQKLIESGSHIREAKQVLSAKFEEHGLRPASKSQLETIFRTQTQIAFAAGKYNAERHDPKVQDALWGYRYVTAGDDRVRPSHAILDGVTLPKGDKFWNKFYPPNGWNCRCQAIPLFEPAKIVRPDKRLPDGAIIKPDVGFGWNAGYIFSALGA